MNRQGRTWHRGKLETNSKKIFSSIINGEVYYKTHKKFWKFNKQLIKKYRLLCEYRNMGIFEPDFLLLRNSCNKNFFYCVNLYFYNSANAPIKYSWNAIFLAEARK